MRERILRLLGQGFTPEKIALSIVLGVTLGIIPVLGFTTLLCAGAATLLELNLPVIQLMNGLVYPAQLALLVPFLRMGEWLFRAHHSAWTVGGIVALIHTNLGKAVATLGAATLHALIVWAFCGFVAAALAYLMLVPILRRLWQHHLAALDTGAVQS